MSNQSCGAASTCATSSRGTGEAATAGRRQPISSDGVWTVTCSATLSQPPSTRPTAAAAPSADSSASARSLP
ncbi:hypothetical protein [Sphaerisporangium album]|uniref:hypothetical protein n=1 Tax=Sphaerisporangium album TaxID=509200 RepID=UPI0011C0308D|nr:hypothetical protein [Sphaerisporangium album]